MKIPNPLRFAVVFIWPVLILLLYYLTHKPFTAETLPPLLLFAWRLVVPVALTGIAGGLGRRLVPLEDLHPLARLSVQAALGLGVLAVGILLIGGTLGLPGWLPWISLLLLAAAFSRSILAWLADWKSLGGLWRESSGFGKVSGLLLAALFLSTLIVALAPPLKYDALMYHLTLPTAYLQEGRIGYLPWIVMSGHPQTAEMIYTWTAALGGLSTAAVTGWMFGLLAVAGLLGYVRQNLGITPAWVAAGSIMAGFTLAASTAWGYVDWLALLFGFGCLVGLDRWRRHGLTKDLLLAGAFAGLALGTKYTAGVLGLAAGVTLVWHIWKRKVRATLAPAAYVAFGLAAAVFALPWLVKNFLVTGNPVYPFFFPSGEMDAVRIAVYQGLPPFGDWRDIFLLPIQATIFGVDAASGYSVAIGPLLLGFGGLAWLGFKEQAIELRTCLQNAAVLAVAGLVIWAVGNQFSGYLIQTRMYYALFPAFAVLAGFGYHAASQVSISRVRLNRVFNALIIIVLSFNVLEIGLLTLRSGAPQAALGLMTKTDYLEKNLGWYARSMQVIVELPEGSQTLLIYEPRSLYCLPACKPDEILDRWVRDYTRLKNNSEILNSWKEAGFTHVLVYRSGVEFLKENLDPHHPLEILQALDEFLHTLPTPADFGGVYELYPLTARR